MVAKDATGLSRGWNKKLPEKMPNRQLPCLFDVTLTHLRNRNVCGFQVKITIPMCLGLP